MKTIFSKNIGILTVLLSLSFISCKKFIDVPPTGQKIPTTFADYEAFMRNEYDNHTTNVNRATLLLNDRFETTANLNYSPLDGVNYNWNESANRITLNNADETTYYSSYSTISTTNLLIENVNNATEGTDAQKAELIAQAKIIQAIAYYTVANYYADTYEEANAANKRAVPLITSANVDAPYKQVSVKEIYDFMLKNVDEAIPALRATSATVLHPNLGAAYAFKARLYLTMGKYNEALTAANEALKYNDKLFDWTAYYAENKSRIEAVDPNNQPVYSLSPSPMGFNFVETYYFRHGLSSNNGRELTIRSDRAARYENGDAMFASRWRQRTVGPDTYFTSITNGFYNHSGLTTTEVYLIKAECQARLNNIGGALTTLDAVRVKHIFPQNYVASSASTVIQAVKLIQRTKGNSLIFGVVPFADMRRLNKDSNYATTLTKTEGGQNLSLSPNSHLWTMPFPLGAIKNPGNGTLEQNVSK
ncbi:RagB/SusD family nutrient uptake outer membrane protein [Pedobacter nyackensis]|uniref:RagB/SusD family nutrient uptake outer membrane protein n=1 Tax=Pedobacter nyackensis TaxID=475255 RepID=UPI002930D75E|nr:RagB/SusD family nutrient uptake outer membrane protein [Pedobacter nyackensis]